MFIQHTFIAEGFGAFFLILLLLVELMSLDKFIFIIWDRPEDRFFFLITVPFTILATTSIDRSKVTNKITFLF